MDFFVINILYFTNKHSVEKQRSDLEIFQDWESWLEILIVILNPNQEDQNDLH